MAWRDVVCVKCGLIMGDRDGMFVGSKPWHTSCHYAILASRLADVESLLRDFGKAEIALDDSEDGLGCDDLINEHVRAYVAIKHEAARLAKGEDHGTDRGTRR